VVSVCKILQRNLAQNRKNISLVVPPDTEKQDFESPLHIHSELPFAQSPRSKGSNLNRK